MDVLMIAAGTVLAGALLWWRTGAGRRAARRREAQLDAEGWRQLQDGLERAHRSV